MVEATVTRLIFFLAGEDDDNGALPANASVDAIEVEAVEGSGRPCRWNPAGPDTADAAAAATAEGLDDCFSSL